MPQGDKPIAPDQKYEPGGSGPGPDEYLDLGLDLQVLKCLDLGLNQVLKMIKSQVLFSKT